MRRSPPTSSWSCAGDDASNSFLGVRRPLFRPTPTAPCHCDVSPCRRGPIPWPNRPGAAHRVGPLSTDMYLPSLPAIAAGLGRPPGGTQLTLSAFLLGFAAGSSSTGRSPTGSDESPCCCSGSGFHAGEPDLRARARHRDPDRRALPRRPSAPPDPSCSGAPSCAISTRARARPRNCRAWARSWAWCRPPPRLRRAVNQAFGWRPTFGAMHRRSASRWRRSSSCDAGEIRPFRRADLLPRDPARLCALLGHPGYRIYVGLSMLAYGGLFAFISGSSFVLQKSTASTSWPSPSPSPSWWSASSPAHVRAALRRRLGLDGTIQLGVTASPLGGVPC